MSIKDANQDKSKRNRAFKVVTCLDLTLDLNCVRRFEHPNRVEIQNRNLHKRRAA